MEANATFFYFDTLRKSGIIRIFRKRQNKFVDVPWKKIVAHFRSPNIDDYNKLSAITSCPIAGDLLIVWEELFKSTEYWRIRLVGCNYIKFTFISSILHLIINKKLFQFIHENCLKEGLQKPGHIGRGSGLLLSVSIFGCSKIFYKETFPPIFSP